MTDLSSFLKSKKRFLLENPDGTYTSCIKTGENDSINEKKELNHKTHYKRESITITDEQVQFIIENHERFDNNNLISQFIANFRLYRFIYLLLFTIEMVLATLLMFITWRDKESSILIVKYRLYI